MKRKSSLIFSILLAVLLLLSCKGKSAASKTSARKPSEMFFFPKFPKFQILKKSSKCATYFQSDGYLVCTHEWDMMSRNGKPIPSFIHTVNEKEDKIKTS